jgi:hypothetical protein
MAVHHAQGRYFRQFGEGPYMVPGIRYYETSEATPGPQVQLRQQ